jgi:hypothetical protein
VRQDGREPLLEAMKQKLRTEDGKQGLGQAQIHGRADLCRDEVGWQEAIDGHAWLDESAG